MIICPLYSGVRPNNNPDIKQVRVIAERASVYIEPSRGSTRIDIVDKGTLLNLLQTKKIKGIWFYVSYSSPRYGARVSGFVLDSAVELADAAIFPAPKEEKPPEKAKIPPPASPPAPVRPQAEEKETFKSPPQGLAEMSEVLVFTEILRKRTYTFSLMPAPLEELPWRLEEKGPFEEKKAKAPAQPEREVKEEVVRPQAIGPARTPDQRKSPGRFTFGLGYGSSFGGAGACFQFSPGMGIALHAGVGIFPTRLIYSETDWVNNETLWNVGIKYYLPIRSSLFFPYVDFQYGGLRVEAAQVITGIWDYDYVYSREQKALWGLSFLAGVEIRRGRFGVGGALGISYVTTSWEFLENKIGLSFDASLVFHF